MFRPEYYVYVACRTAKSILKKHNNDQIILNSFGSINTRGGRDVGIVVRYPI